MGSASHRQRAWNGLGPPSGGDFQKLPSRPYRSTTAVRNCVHSSLACELSRGGVVGGVVTQAGVLASTGTNSIPLAASPAALASGTRQLKPPGSGSTVDQVSPMRTVSTPASVI